MHKAIKDKLKIKKNSFCVDNQKIICIFAGPKGFIRLKNRIII